MSESKISGDVVKEYLYKYPSISSRKLAETICSDIPELFTNVETCRNSIRYYRGSIGNSNRLKLILRN